MASRSTKRRCRRTRASRIARCSTVRTRASRSPTRRRSPSRATRKRAPARTMSRRCSIASSRPWRRAPSEAPGPSHPPDRRNGPRARGVSGVRARHGLRTLVPHGLPRRAQRPVGCVSPLARQRDRRLHDVAAPGRPRHFCDGGRRAGQPDARDGRTQQPHRRTDRRDGHELERHAGQGPARRPVRHRRRLGRRPDHLAAATVVAGSHVLTGLSSMPKRTDLKTILIIGAGPIVIGQACEFDYSGAQACKALRDEGYRVVLVNSNPATIMTDPEMADAVYIEPINWQTVEKIIAKEKPDALLPTMGGQTALNCALDLADNGVLEKYDVELIGASRDAIRMAEDRELFRVAMAEIGLDCPKAAVAKTFEQAVAIQATV